MADATIKARALCREILEQVLVAASDGSDELRQRCRAVAGEAKQHQEVAAAAMRDEAEHAAAMSVKRSLAQADYRAYRQRLETKERLVGSLLTEGFERCLEAWKTRGPSLVEDLAVEGVRGLGDRPEVILRMGGLEGAALPKGLTGRIETRCLREFGRRVTVRLEPAGEDAAAGVVVSTPDGDVRYDNTIEDRFRRASEVLHSEVGSLLGSVAAGAREELEDDK